MVDNKIDDDPNAALLGAVGELDEVAERAVAGIDLVVVGDVIAVIAAGRGLERQQPDRVDAKAVDVIEPAQQALEIANTIAVGVHEGANREAIDDSILVPEIVDHRRCYPDHGLALSPPPRSPA